MQVADQLEWPANGLEAVPACPVCGDRNRSILHSGLTDNVFYCAPGRWTLHRCHGCRSAYLDPRPNRETIGRAYADYYTHRETSTSTREIPARGGATVRRSLRNGYLSARFGYELRPRSRVGPIVMPLLPAVRTVITRRYRHLSRARGVPDRILDVGCGNATFLRVMREVGWQTEGVEPDAVAVGLARAAGLLIHHATLEDARLPSGRYGAVTLSHVIEHVHDPGAMLRECHRLLAPGGTLWMATPNLLSPGHRMFGRHWRGLEPPRHLTLFTRRALRELAEGAGFSRWSEPEPVRAHAWAEESIGIAHRDGAVPSVAAALTATRNRVRLADLLSTIDRDYAEEIVATVIR